MRRHTPFAVLLPLIMLVPVARAADSSSGTRKDPPPIPSGLRLNELDYDQPGIDTAEFVEIVNLGDQRYRLRKVDLVLVNGVTSADYRRVELSGLLGPARRLVVATSAVTVDGNAKVLPLPLASNNVQNGSPDGVALVDTADRVILDALSYEGAMTEVSIDGLPGTWSLVQGQPVGELDDNEVTGSLCRLPDKADSEDDDADWARCQPTPGGTNAAP
jgi:hypothetical protein